MPPSPAENRDLRSWKEIADYLGITVRTAQRYEQDLGLPVSRLPGAKGRICTSTSGLEAWKEARRGAANGAGKIAVPPPRFVPLRLLLIIVAGVLVCVAVALGWWFVLRPAPIAEYFRVESSTLVASDAGGAELWRYRFGDSLNDYRDRLADSVRHEDLDGDGETEVLFNKQFDVGGVLRTELVCFSAWGKVKWSFTPGRRRVETPTHRNLLPYFHTIQFRVDSLDRNYPKTILAVSLHDSQFPTQVALVSPRGKLIREYWHSGYLSHLQLADLDGNGRQEIYLGGVSNGSKCATVVVLDPETMGGASVEENPDYGILELGPGREIARILFQRSCINTNSKNPDTFNDVARLRTAEGRLQVETQECKSPCQAALDYILDSQLRVLEVLPADTFIRAHLALRAGSALDHDFKMNELDQLRNVRVLRPGDVAMGDASAAR